MAGCKMRTNKRVKVVTIAVADQFDHAEVDGLVRAGPAEFDFDYVQPLTFEPVGSRLSPVQLGLDLVGRGRDRRERSSVPGTGITLGLV